MADTEEETESSVTETTETTTNDDPTPPEPPVTSRIVEFDEALWYRVFPQFMNKVSSEQLVFWWDFACSFIDNTERGRIPYDTAKGIYVRRTALFYLMCHLATLNEQIQSGQAGPITSASTGSVSTSFQVDSGSSGNDKAAWLKQTQCGKAVWALMCAYSTGGLYVPHKTYHPWG